MPVPSGCWNRLSGFTLMQTFIVRLIFFPMAKGVKKRPGQLQICYCHTPMRYAWDLREQYLIESGLNSGLKGVIVNSILDRIKQWDYKTAQQVDHFIANSYYISDRIRRAYGRDSTVIYPPVDINAFQLNEKKEDFFLAASRMVSYKKIDMIVEAFSENGLPLVVIGDGQDFEKVKSRAKKNIEFLGFQKDEALINYMQKAKAFIFAAEEDFGIVPVEAQACGTPVIAYGKGGIAETVIPFQNKEKAPPPTGIFFDEQTPGALIDAVKKFETVADKLDPGEIRRNAERFGVERFKRELKDFMNKKVQEFFA